MPVNIPAIISEFLWPNFSFNTGYLYSLSSGKSFIRLFIIFPCLPRCNLIPEASLNVIKASTKAIAKDGELIPLYLPITIIKEVTSAECVDGIPP